MALRNIYDEFEKHYDIQNIRVLQSIRVLQKQVYIHHTSSISLIKQWKASMHAKIIQENQEHNT